MLWISSRTAKSSASARAVPLRLLFGHWPNGFFAGLHVRGVSTSGRTASLATELGIPLVDLDTIDAIDIAFDGADEVAEPTLDMVKGLGGAMLHDGSSPPRQSDG